MLVEYTLFEEEKPHKTIPKVESGKTSLIHLAASGNSIETFKAILKDSPGDLMKVDTYEKGVLNYAQARKDVVS